MSIALRVIGDLSPSRALRVVLSLILSKYTLKSTLTRVSSVLNIMTNLVTLFGTRIHSSISSIATVRECLN